MTAPISAMCPIVAAKATSSPPWKTGRRAACAPACGSRRGTGRCAATTSPGPNDVGAELVEHAAHRLADRAEVRRVEAALRDHPAVAVEERAREVARLAEDRRVGGAHHVRAHLLRDLDELVADHAHRHAVDLAPRAPAAPVARRAAGSRRRARAAPGPGGRASSSRAPRRSPGRASTAPAGRSSRRKTGVASVRAGEADVARRARRRQRRPRAATPGAGRAPGPSAVTFAWISSIGSPGKL